LRSFCHHVSTAAFSASQPFDELANRGIRPYSKTCKFPFSDCALVTAREAPYQNDHGLKHPDSRNFNSGGQIVLSGVKIESRSEVMPKECSKPITEGLDTASTQFREFAAECVDLARNSSSPERRMVYLEMASIWHQTALRWQKDFQKSRSLGFLA
jgi:hypothetical protein